jgi:hypothetical protein
VPLRIKEVKQIMISKNYALEFPIDSAEILLLSQLNQAKLKDEAIVNPWIDDNGVNKNYLSTESTVTIIKALDASEPEIATL